MATVEPLTRISPPRSYAVRAVAKAARERVAEDKGDPCDDLEGCIRVVYVAAVADALTWVLGEGPPPSGFSKGGPS